MRRTYEMNFSVLWRSLSSVDKMKSSSNVEREIHRYTFIRLSVLFAFSVCVEQKSHTNSEHYRISPFDWKIANAFYATMLLSRKKRKIISVRVVCVCDGNGHGDSSRLWMRSKILRWRHSTLNAKRMRDNKRKIGWPKSCRDCTIEFSFSLFLRSFVFHFSEFLLSIRICRCFECEIDSMSVAMLRSMLDKNRMPKWQMANCAHAIAFSASINQISRVSCVCIVRACVHWFCLLIASIHSASCQSNANMFTPLHTHRVCLGVIWIVFLRKTQMILNRRAFVCMPNCKYDRGIALNEFRMKFPRQNPEFDGIFHWIIAVKSETRLLLLNLSPRQIFGIFQPFYFECDKYAREAFTG